MLPSKQTRQIALRILVKQFKLVVLVMVTSVAIIVWILFLKPAQAELNKVQEKSDQLKIDLETKQIQFKSLVETNKSIAQIDAQDNDKLTLAFPDHIDHASLWLYFSAIAEMSNVELISLDIVKTTEAPKFADGTENEDMEVVEVMVHTKGAGYSLFKKLIKNMEDHVPLTNLRRFEYAADNENLDFQFEFYVLRENEEI